MAVMSVKVPDVLLAPKLALELVVAKEQTLEEATGVESELTTVRMWAKV